MCDLCLLPCVFKSCLLYSISSGLLVIPGVSTLPCVTLMSSLKTIILKLILVCVFLVSPCCVHRDTKVFWVVAKGLHTVKRALSKMTFWSLYFHTSLQIRSIIDVHSRSSAKWNIYQRLLKKGVWLQFKTYKLFISSSLEKQIFQNITVIWQ